MRPGRHFSGGGISRKIKKISARVGSFKSFTALNIRPPAVFCDVSNAPNSYSARAPPIRTLGSSPHSTHSLVGLDLRHGGAVALPFVPGTTDPRASTELAMLLRWCSLHKVSKTRVKYYGHRLKHYRLFELFDYQH